MNYCSICRAKIDESENLCPECKFRGRRSTLTWHPEGNGKVPANVPALVSGVVPAASALGSSAGIRSALQAIVDESEVCTPENMQRFWQAVDAGKQDLKQSA